MSLLQRLQSAKKKLSKVETVVTKPDGTQLIEKRAGDGGFKQKPLKETSSVDDDKLLSIQEGDETTATTPSESTKGDADEISKRRAKRIARAQKCGYVIDLKPDLQVAHIAECVYLGSQDVAADYTLLAKHKITHIINCATGIKNLFPKKFKYLNLDLLDEPNTLISNHFKTVNEYILNAISNKGRVFIHCNAGISRACTLAIAYIMWSQRKSFHDAYEYVKKVRFGCRPNDGFIKQLKEYENELFNSGFCRTS